MRRGPYDYGSRVMVNVTKAFAAAGAGTATEIPLDKMPRALAGMGLAVLGLFVRLPTATFLPTTSCVVDGASFAQLIASLRLTVAAGSPPAVQGHQEMIPTMDFYRLATVLSFISGQPVIVGAGGPLAQHGAGDVDSTTSPFSLGAFTESRRIGYLQNIGPFGETDGSAANAVVRPVFYLPIGERDGEDEDSFAIPAEWFAGKVVDESGACGGGTGQASSGGTLTITQGSAVDGAAVSWGGEGIDVFAVCVRTPPDVRPQPLTLKVKVSTSSGSELRGVPGMQTCFAAFMKELTAGAQAAHDYTDVVTSAGGVPVHWNESTFHLRAVGYFLRREVWRPTLSETALSNGGAARKSRSLYPLVLHDGSLLRAPGDSEGLRINVNTTGEISHKLVEAGYIAHTDASNRAAEAWHGQGFVSVPNARNGNDVPEHVAQLLPRRTVRAS